MDLSVIKNSHIGCIGTGNIGSAIIAGVSSSITQGNLHIFDIDTGKTDFLTEQYGAYRSPSILHLARESDIIILAVKPYQVDQVIHEIHSALSKKILISVAGGITTARMIQAAGPDVEVIRIMPNTPATIGQGMSVISPAPGVSPSSVQAATELFSLIGKTSILPESLMDAVTGLSGSGPAYVFTFIQALADGGVKMGIPREQAVLLAAQTVQGAALMVLNSAENPISLRCKVTSPGGTTIEGIHVMERAGFNGIVMDAVQAAAEKSRKLGGS